MSLVICVDQESLDQLAEKQAKHPGFVQTRSLVDLQNYLIQSFAFIRVIPVSCYIMRECDTPITERTAVLFMREV